MTYLTLKFAAETNFKLQPENLLRGNKQLTARYLVLRFNLHIIWLSMNAPFLILVVS